MSSVKNKRVGGDVNKQPYRSGKTHAEQMRSPTERDVTSVIKKPESEMVKPYRSDSYEEMEYDFIEPWNFTPADPLTFNDSPFGGPELDPVDFPGAVNDYLFFCGGTYCWCAGETKDFPGKCTHQIVSVKFSSEPGPTGFSVGFSGGKILITAPTGADSFTNFSIDINMRAPKSGGGFVYGSHLDIPVGECRPDAACCNCDGPTIQYTTQTMGVDETQDLAVQNPGSSGAACFTWSLSGGGSLSDTTGLTTTYTAPSSNANCANNATITLSCLGSSIDTLEIAINDYTLAGHVASGAIGACVWDLEYLGPVCTDGCGTKFPTHVQTGCVDITYYKCDGTQESVQSGSGYHVNGGHFNGECHTHAPAGGSGGTQPCPGGAPDGSACTCALILTRLNSWHAADAGKHTALGFSSFSSSEDFRDATMKTGGCCPEQLL